MYAVVETGGRQYKVTEGQFINVEKIVAEPGQRIELDRVLLLSDDKVTVGQPIVAGAKVVAKVVGEERGEKIIVFKYKPKVRYRRKLGHRQTYTRLAIEQIVSGNEEIVPRDEEMVSGNEEIAPGIGEMVSGDEEIAPGDA